ncbi:MAG TPA: mucoidy inhibitor MuiA family protein [Phycisphaerales bacterium]|nr:mucoidy inhibitor MuiA family protein [Phycisphaerales bacterium]
MMHSLRALPLLFLPTLALSFPLLAQASDSSSPPASHAALPDVRQLIVPVQSVTVFPVGASINREAFFNLAPGEYLISVPGLPDGLDPETLLARITGPATILNVDSRRVLASGTDDNPLLADVDSQITDLSAKLRDSSDSLDLLTTQDQWLQTLGARTASDAAQNLGTEKFDINALDQQFQAILQRREKLLKQIRDLRAAHDAVDHDLQVLTQRRNQLFSTAPQRIALINLSVKESAPLSLHLSYYVAEASWRPSYNIRATDDGASASIESLAIVSQSSGEDWTDVALNLSTAQPTRSTVPPAAEPWYVDVASAENASLNNQSNPSVPTSPEQAGLFYTGPTINVPIPRRVTIASAPQSAQHVRIAAFDAAPDLVHYAVPYVSGNVYVRGTLTNAGASPLLPGRASVFYGSQYVGSMDLPLIPAGSQFSAYFGLDRSVTVFRQLVDRNFSNTGLLGGGRRVTYNFRVGLSNYTGQPVNLELWDRMPTSRSDEIQIDLENLSHPLATDSYYVRNQMPLGLLKWRITLPPQSHDADTVFLTYTVRINHAKNVDLSPLPE